MLTADLGEPIQLRIQAADGATALFPVLTIYDETDDVVETLVADHVADGLYTASWTPSVAGRYAMTGQFWADVGHSIDAGYDRPIEDIDVTAEKAKIDRLLGLGQENSVLDLAVYNPQGRVTAARIRLYDSAANALAASATGLIATYSVAATYSGTQLTSYTRTLEP